MSTNTHFDRPTERPDKNKGVHVSSGNVIANDDLPINAVALLKADHEMVTQLFVEFALTDDDTEKLEIARTICTELKIHTLLEEEIFYPAARDALDMDDLLDEAAVEHDSAKELIAQIEEGAPDDDKWSAKVKVLGEYVRHHINEEQTELFPAVEASDIDLEDLGEEMFDRKQDLVAQFADEANDFYDDDDR